MSLEQSDGKSGDPIYQAVELLLKNLSVKGKSLLDFGAGRGLFLQRIQKSGMTYEGCGADLLERPAGLKASTEWIQSDLNIPLEIKDENFDVLTGIEIIEHLENPRAVAREWFRLLRPGGVVICSTPNSLSIRSKLSLLVRGHFLEFGDSSYPAHITALLKLDLQRILEEAGFEGIEFSYTNFGRVPKFKSLTWQSISGGMLKGSLFSDNIMVSARKPE